MFDEIEDALKEISAGRFVILVDDEDRENEGDLVLAAEMITPEAVNFMAKHARGLICLALTPERADELQLHPQASENTAPFGTAFTVSIDAGRDITTGISAADRSTTIRMAVDPSVKASDFSRPGHIFPLRSQKGGVLKRAGQTEGSVDLARLAGMVPAGVICEILAEDGTMMRRPQLELFSKEHGLTFVTVAQLVAYRLQNERLVHRVANVRLPTSFGEFRLVGYRNDVDDREHVALVYGEVAGQEDVMVRMHSKCLTGDVFGSQRCDCGFQLHRAMEIISQAGRGVIVYLDQEGRGIGLLNKLKAYALQDEGHDTVEANEHLGFPPDLRNYGIGAQILLDQGLSSIRVLTNNPMKLVGLEGYGLTMVERISIQPEATDENRSYLDVKRDKLGHLLSH